MNCKKTIAIALVTAVASTGTAFAAPVTGTANKTQTTVVAEQEKTVYTFEKALELAKKNSSDLALLEKNSDLLNEKTDDAFQNSGGLAYSQMGNIQTENYAAIMELGSLGSARETERYTKEAKLKSLEGGVMKNMGTIVTGEAELSASDLTLSNAQTNYNMVVLKKSLGMATDTQVTAAKAEFEQVKAKVEQTKKDVENSYANLATVMGIRNTDFVVDYNPEYVVYKLNGPLDQFLAQKNDENPTLKGAQISLDYTKANKSFILANETSPYGYDELMYKIEKAEAELKSSRDGLISAGRSVYANIVNIEENIIALESGLKAAQDAQKIAEISLGLGKATQVDVDKAKDSVASLENQLFSLKINHALLVFAFNNPAAGISG